MVDLPADAFPTPRSIHTPATESGLPLPLGPHTRDDGTNFAVFSRHATGVWLELFDDAAHARPRHRFELKPDLHRTGDIWHIWIEDVSPDQLYAYRANGPYEPRHGHRFNPHKLLLDPYATALTHREDWDFRAARGYDSSSSLQDLSFSNMDNAGASPKCIVTRRRTGWEKTRPLERPWSETIIYELHVRGYTIHPSAGVDAAGTYRGLTEKIPYLKDLGVTAVELMPVQEFNENELPRVNPLTGEQLHNYWGYNPVSFTAPKAAYAGGSTRGEHVNAFKEMVKAFHQAEIEVILDVVFNHTAEGGELGPTISWRGLDNSIYYLLDDDKRSYKDFTGTGNTIKAQHPVVRDLILDALRYWVVEMHVDGFRFDLASVLGRDEEGHLRTDPPLLERIAHDPVLRHVKIIAEAWDLAGAYQVGSFHARRWSEWNGRYRDDVRRFWRGDSGMDGAFAQRLMGSPDLYRESGKGPESSINYVTCHDGFTLNDLVSYARKHNHANGESNRDGTDANYSANYGVEGPTEDETIEAVRRRQIKNFLLTLFVSRGVPMLLGGDEFRRTQHGNNNAYCQDNETGWWLWDRRREHADIHRFTRQLIAFRQSRSALRKTDFYRDEEVQWFTPEGRPPDWNDRNTAQLACLIDADGSGKIMLLFNASTDRVDFTLPTLPPARTWHRRADTSRPSPEDIHPEGEETPLDNPQSYPLTPRSSAVLLAL